MKTIKLPDRLTIEEKETIIMYDGIDRKWRDDTTFTKHMNKLLKQGWTQLKEYVYEDGTVCGGVFEGPERSITFRNTEKKQMSEKQMLNLLSDEDEDEE